MATIHGEIFNSNGTILLTQAVGYWINVLMLDYNQNPFNPYVCESNIMNGTYSLTYQPSIIDPSNTNIYLQVTLNSLSPYTFGPYNGTVGTQKQNINDPQVVS